MKIPASKIVFTEEEIENAKTSLDISMQTGQMILGPYTTQFEEEYAELHRRKHGIAVSSDTAGVEICLRTYQIGEGDKVLFPANGFYGIVIPILRCGAVPIFFDIEWNTNLFVHENTIEKLILEHKPKALILMHTGGMVASRSREISNVCKKHNVICIEDAAHAPGAKMNGEYAGSFGNASVFSLYATKPINAGEGGIILTDDDDFVDIAKAYRNYGRTVDFSSGICNYQGYSWRLTEIQAAMGLGQVRRQDEIREERESIALEYEKYIWKLEDIGVHRFKMERGSASNWYRYLMILPKDYLLEDKNDLKQIMYDDYDISIPGDVYEIAVPHQPVWGNTYSELSFPVTSEWGNRHIALPLYPSLTSKEQAYIVDSLVEGLQVIF